MRKILVLAASVLFCSTMARQTLAADDVYVDLSVLDEIGGNSSSSAYGKPDPLFPVIKNTPQFPIVKKAEPKPTKVSKKAEKKKTVKKAKPQKKIEKKKAEKVIIPEKPKEIMPETVKPEAAQQKEPAAEKQAEKTLASQPQTLPENKAEVKLPEAKAAPQEEVAPQAETQAMPFKVEKTTPAETITPAPVKEVVAEPVEPAKEPTAENEQPEVQQTQSAEEKTVEPLLPVAGSLASEPEKNIEKVKREIIFAEGSYELDDVAKEKIDAIIASFDDAKANKIAIMAYNYDNGEDVFRKKRQSLNRAIEIRSYLLNKGYKNFSIKVINITDDAAQGNVVEIDELK